MKRIDFVTIFPEYFDVLKLSLIGTAQKSGIVEFNTVNLRDFAPLPHRSVDDKPYGGGAGMVMKVDILVSAIESVLQDRSILIFTTPAGERFNQKAARELSTARFEHLIIVCGRFEGFDARCVQYFTEKLGCDRVREISIGDYVLNGGEVAALAMVEAIVRLVPGVVGNPASLVEESHELSADGEPLLEYPNFTRPEEFRGLRVPSVLLSGNHAEIEKWRRERCEAV
ncbi:MAG: tRNA (guanosine(37)-N1)-methyltransferase TrmD [Candidatus Ancillula sp.]|jgi:tRNA (guanine37-N1)-methyltransferase|nr:tRNA (guanosine(37)-N1)-methyltransferase TrmD [Candidatus Ancillula sp.]